MRIVKQRGNLLIYAGDGMARGLYIAENIKTGKMSNWSNKPQFKLSDCID